jgi:sugar phosphate isomerase/epimerase
VGLSWGKLDPGREAKIAALLSAGLRSSTVTSRRFDLAAPQTWPEARAAIATSVDNAVTTHGTSVYITSGSSDGRTWDELLDAFAAALGPCVTDAAARGVRLSLEPSLRCDASFVNTLRDAIEVAKVTGIGLVVDFGNCWMERDLTEVVRRAGPHIGLVQLCDVRLGPDAPPAGSRVVPGDGMLQLARLMGDVLDTGYDGLFDMEILGPDVEREGYASALRRGVDVASEFLASLGI